MAKIVGNNILGSNISAPIVPFTVFDEYPTHEAEYGKGGLRTVNTITQRDAITEERREVGMMVYVASENLYYRLAGGITNDHWELFTLDREEIAQVQPDWNQDDDEELDYIRNKPTKLTQFENDGYFVQDDQYLRYTQAEKDKLAELEKYTQGERITITDGKINADLQSDENFTAALKTKLELLEDPKYKGTFLSLSHLYLSYPTGKNGESADVKIDDEFHRFMWEGLVWKDYGPLGSETSESVRVKYETNPLSMIHSMKTKLDTIEEGAQKNVDSGLTTKVWTADSENMVFKGSGTEADPLKAWHICVGSCGCGKCCDGGGETMSTIHTADTDTIKMSGVGTATNPVVSNLDNNLKAKIDLITDGGSGTKYLSDAGIYKSMAGQPLMVTEFTGGGEYEKGQTVNTVTLSWNYNQPVTSQSINGMALSIGTTTTTLTSQNITSNLTYVLTAGDGGTTVTAETAIVFKYKRYWGASENENLNQSQVLALSSELSDDFVQTKTFNCTDGKYIWLAWPSEYGVPQFKVSGLTFSGMLKSTLFSFTNSSGATFSLDMYRTEDIQHGSTIKFEVE